MSWALAKHLDGPMATSSTTSSLPGKPPRHRLRRIWWRLYRAERGWLGVSISPPGTRAHYKLHRLPLRLYWMGCSQVVEDQGGKR